VDTPAKLNLFLRVLARRTDGYHELETLMVPIGLCDTLLLAPLPTAAGTTELRLAPTAGRSGPVLSTGDDNLVSRAVRELRQATGIQADVQITLHKRIPIAAGLAGGSSDAAAALVGLNRLWDLGLPAARLLEIGATIGSDVNFFVAGARPALCRGRGEIVEPVAGLRPLPVVIVKPPSGLSTPEVFRHCRPRPDGPLGSELVQRLRRAAPAELSRLLVNDLEEPARHLNPELDRIQETLAQQPVVSHLMSGSGTACFGVCRTLRQARQIAGRLRAGRTGRVYVARTVF
jgi:4-diphosphocytidyl-2-C-methyl-D-erythritol kinase